MSVIISMHCDLIQFPNADLLAAAVADRWLDVLTRTDSGDARIAVALSGGRIAPKLFASLVETIRQRQADLRRVHFFWADERCVGPEDRDSNFAVANEFLFRPLQTPLPNVHRVLGELDPEAAARNASEELLGTVSARQGGWPVLDLVLLGMGEDGHIASLFPGNVPGGAPSEIYDAVVAPKPPPRRITLTFGPLIAAREVLLVVSGPGKKDSLSHAMSGTGGNPAGELLRRRAWTRVYINA